MINVIHFTLVEKLQTRFFEKIIPTYQIMFSLSIIVISHHIILKSIHCSLYLHCLLSKNDLFKIPIITK